ncbi:hypothetical protein GCM10010885_13300 [Alicyclobacillus cellulosilyticus]|uniref:Uncharacterized protein n=1 Tax=Alicyclobacillus cellulosilyticus TaxID=1003997 RepID=A0A917NJL2_9BACL|nr:hypothetical protein GCM10010885_13300 [Alicyclobacillus cellulosilyticus]
MNATQPAAAHPASPRQTSAQPGVLVRAKPRLLAVAHAIPARMNALRRPVRSDQMPSGTRNSICVNP